MAKKAARPADPRPAPVFVTLAPAVTVCTQCAGRPVVYSALVFGLPRKLDPLPLSVAGLSAAVAAGRWVGVVRPYGAPMVNRATPGHWWVTGIAGTNYRPVLLAEHEHGAAPLPADAGQAVELLPRFLPEPPPARGIDDPPPF